MEGSWVKEGLSHFLSSFLPLGSLADLSKARPHMSEHQNLFHCDITDAMACEITMCKAEGADYLGKLLLELWHPTKFRQLLDWSPKTGFAVYF